MMGAFVNDRDSNGMLFGDKGERIPAEPIDAAEALAVWNTVLLAKEKAWVYKESTRSL